MSLVNGTSFFDNFDYFTGYDPTAGFVHYLNLEQATQFVRTLLPFYVVYMVMLPPSRQHCPPLPHHDGDSLAIGFHPQQ
jgi:hypothetical protein